MPRQAIYPVWRNLLQGFLSCMLLAFDLDNNIAPNQKDKRTGIGEQNADATGDKAAVWVRVGLRGWLLSRESSEWRLVICASSTL